MIPPAVERWRYLANKYALNGLEPNEILAIIWSESSGNEGAMNHNDPSYGLMQLTLGIGMRYAGVESWQQLMDPERNVQAGAGFLGYLKQRYSVQYPNNAWVAAYNEGEGNLRKGIADQKYVDAFTAHLAALDAQDGSPSPTVPSAPSQPQ